MVILGFEKLKPLDEQKDRKKNAIVKP